MNTRTLIIIGLITAIVISITYVSLAYNQEIKLFTGMITGDEKPQPSKLTDPVCFVVDRATSGETGSAVTMDTCFSLKQFEEMGCTKPMLEHILRYSNLLDYDVNGPIYLEWAGLSEGISQEKFDECFDAISEKRPILDSIPVDASKSCPDGQDYNKVLFKCVISCEDDLVYNGYTDSCTTEFELKYHGFCNEEFTYNPSSHTCYSDDGTLQTPLKDPPRTPPPEPVPMKCKSGSAPSDDYYFDEETCNWIEREWYEGDQFEKIIRYCTDPESNPTGETASISKGGEIKLDSKNCMWLHGSFYNQIWVEQTSDPVPLIYDGNVISPEGNVIRPVK